MRTFITFTILLLFRLLFGVPKAVKVIVEDGPDNHVKAIPLAGILLYQSLLEIRPHA